MSIGVFCNVSKQEAWLLPNTMRPLLRHSGVESIVIMHTSKDVPVSYGVLAEKFDKVREFHRPSGEGYELSVQEGGYDQYSARLFALEVVEEAQTDWIVQFDADEFLTTNAIDVILSSSEEHDVIAFDYYTPLSETDYWFERKLLRRTGRTDIIDPHLLIWRRRLEKRPELCPQSVKLFRNKTRHCSVAFPNFPYWRILAANGLYHFHFHCLLSKKNARKRTHSKKFCEPLPHEAKECMHRICNGVAVSIGEVRCTT